MLVRIIFRRFVAGSALVFIIVWFSIGLQVSSYKNDIVEATRYQPFASIVAYLHTQAPAQSVVLADPAFTATEVMIYTQDFVYDGGEADATFQVPQSRLAHDYFVWLALQGVTAQSVRQYIYQRDNRSEIGYLFFNGVHWRDQCGWAGCFPDSVLENLIPQYQAFLKTPLLQNIKKYKVDYLLVDAKANGNWNLSQLPLTEVAASGDFTLYSFK